MADRGPHSKECATATGGDCHCDCHGAMHGVTHTFSRGGKHLAGVQITPVKGRGGKVSHYRVIDVDGLPPGGGTKEERVAARAKKVTITATTAAPTRAADFARWRKHTSLPGRNTEAGPSRRQERLAELRDELAAAVAAHEKAVTEATADLKRRRVPLYARPGKLAEATKETEWAAERARRDVEAVEQYDGDPGYDAPSVGKRSGVQPIDRAAPLAVYGDMLHLHDESDSTHHNVTELEKAPATLHAAVRDHLVERPGGGIFVGDSMIVDLDSLGYLRGEQPRGWSPGSSFASVPGVYDPAKGVVAIGHAHKGHGSQSVALHEFGHGADEAIGKKLNLDGGIRASQSPEFRTVHGLLRRAGDAKPYVLQAGDAGLSEAWAEGFAAWAQATNAGVSPIPVIANALGTRDTLVAGAFAAYYKQVTAAIDKAYQGQ